MVSPPMRPCRPEGGSDRDRHPQGPGPLAGLVAEGDRARPRQRIARNVLQGPPRRLPPNPCEHPEHVADGHRDGSRCAWSDARRDGEGSGRLAI